MMSAEYGAFALANAILKLKIRTITAETPQVLIAETLLFQSVRSGLY